MSVYELFVTKGPEKDQVFLFENEQVIIGRDSTCEISLNDRTVSRQHARILKTERGFSVVEEAGALHGTFVNETRLTPGQDHALEDGDRLSLGSVCVVFRH